MTLASSGLVEEQPQDPEHYVDAMGNLRSRIHSDIYQPPDEIGGDTWYNTQGQRFSVSTGIWSDPPSDFGNDNEMQAQALQDQGLYDQPQAEPQGGLQQPSFQDSYQSGSPDEQQAAEDFATRQTGLMAVDPNADMSRELATLRQLEPNLSEEELNAAAQSIVERRQQVEAQGGPSIGGFLGGIENLARSITPNYIENSQTPDYLKKYPGADTVRNVAGDVLAAPGRFYDQQIGQSNFNPLGLPRANGSAENLLRGIGEMSVPTTYAELAAAPLIGLAPGVDDALKAGGRRALAAAPEIADAARGGLRTIMPPQLLGSTYAGIPGGGEDIVSQAKKLAGEAEPPPVEIPRNTTPAPSGVRSGQTAGYQGWSVNGLANDREWRTQADRLHIPIQEDNYGNLTPGSRMRLKAALDAETLSNSVAIPSGTGGTPQPPGAATYYHGTAGPITGDTLEPGAFVTTNRADAETFARTQAKLTGQEPHVVEVNTAAVKPTEEGLAGSRGAMQLTEATPFQEAPPPGSRTPGGRPPVRPPEPPVSGAPDPAKALDGIVPGETVPDAAFRQYEGAVNAAATTERVNLDSGAAKLREVGKTPGVPDEDVRALYSALHGGGDVPENLQPIYDDVKRLLAEEEALTLDFDPKFQLSPDYFPRFWKAPELTNVGPNRLGAKPAFTKPRVDATFDELLQAGYEPRTWNPYEMVALRRMAGAEYREQGRLLNILKGEGLVTDVQGPLVEGWRIPDVTGAVFQPKPYQDAAGVIQFTPPKQVPNEVANVLEQMFGRQLNWGTVGKVDVHNAISTVFNAPKRAKLLASLFQQSDFARRTGFQAFGAAINDVVSGKPLEAIMDVVRLPKQLLDLAEANISPAARANLRKTLVSDLPISKERPSLTWNKVSKGGLSTGDVSAFNKTMRDSLTEAIKGDGVVGRPRQIINAINGAMERGLFEGVYPQAQKTAIENFIGPATIRAHPDWTDAQLAGSIATEANKMFSSLPRSQSVMRHVNRNLTEAARFAIFSTNETESFIKATASMARGPNKAMWGEYWAGGLIFLGALAETISLAVTGEPLPTDRLSPVKPGGPFGIQYNSRFFAPDVARGAGRGGTNLSLDLLAQMDTAFRLLDPKSFWEGRENVTLRTITNQIKGKDFYGRPLDSVKRRVGQAISDIGLPIGAQNLTGTALSTFPALEGWIADNEARLGKGQLLQVTGENLRAETNQMIRDRIAQSVGVDKWENLQPLDREEALKNNPDLARELALRGDEAVGRGAESAARIREIQALRTQQQMVDDEAFKSGELSGADWREQRGDRNASAGAAIRERSNDFEGNGQMSTGLVAQAREAYSKIINNSILPNGQVDWDKVDREVVKLTPMQQETIRQDRFAGSTDQERAYLAGIETVLPYFDRQDKAFEEAKARNPETFGKFDNLEAYKKAQSQSWRDQGFSKEQADGLAQTMLDALLPDAKIQGIFYLFEHPEQARFLMDYGFYVPAAAKKVAQLSTGVR